MSYLYTEKYSNDLTYFIYFQVDAIFHAFEEMKIYLDKKTSEFQRIAEMLEKNTWDSTLKFIQKYLIKEAAK